MGKKHKHSQDKLYKTPSELQSQQSNSGRELELSRLHRRLKFDSCCLSLNTVTKKPVGLCDDQQYCFVFECDLVVKFLEKFKVHPVTGQKVSAADLIELKFHKNNQDEYHCPVIFKLFNQHSKLVANKRSGHVYSYEAYEQLNLKANNYKDLLTDEHFQKSDIVTIQDPSLADVKWNVSQFFHVKNKLKIEEETNESNIRDIERSEIIKSSLEEYKRKECSIAENYRRILGVEDESPGKTVKQLDKINSAHYSDGALSSSVTSTVMPFSAQRAAMLSDDDILYPRIKKKGYVQIMTNLGPLNLELYCDRTPKTCHNFLLLASKGYYEECTFHRLVKNFIIQGGDPTGTGRGGQSAWGAPFRDECHRDLKHDGQGVLAMANSGPGTNKSQFYITLDGVWDHLDGKHTVFGRVVGGYETLNKINSIEVDKKERPKAEIKILKIIKYVDPYEEAERAIAEERKKEIERKKMSSRSASELEDLKQVKKFRSGIGSYINLDNLNVKSRDRAR